MAYANKLRVIYGNVTLGLSGDGFHYIFSYERGGPGLLRLNGKEWLYREPVLTFWRATTDNDRGSGFNVWFTQQLAADTFHKCVGIDLTVGNQHFAELPIAPIASEFSDPVSAKNIKTKYTFETLTVPATQVTVACEVNGQGEVKVIMHYYSHKDLPDLPVVGMCFIISTVAIGFGYQGLSDKTYPDRVAGATEGTFHVDGLLVTKYLVPQENGIRMNTHALTITHGSAQNNADRSREPFSSTIKQGEQPSAFSCLPYIAEELENVTHIEEFPLVRRTVLVIAGVVRGAGGIDSWGAGVEEQYHIPTDRDVEFSFVLNTK